MLAKFLSYNILYHTISITLMGTGGLQAKEHIMQGVSGAITSNDNSQIKSSLKRAEINILSVWPFPWVILCPSNFVQPNRQWDAANRETVTIK